MNPKVYIETSVISYLTARPSRDLIVAAHQQITYDWWENQRGHFELYTSQIVLTEVSAGDPSEAKRRIKTLNDIELLDVNNETADFAEKLLQQNCLPKKAAEDALHIAIATVHRMTYLLTWNCKHIANAQIRPVIEKISNESGYQPPIFCTPEELIGESYVE